MAAAYPGAPETIPEIIAAYESQIGEIESLVRDMTAQQVRARPVPGKWSTLELLCHLADCEQIMADRMKRAIAETRPLLMAFVESRFAAALAYDLREPAEELAVLAATRRQMVRILRALPADAWDRTAVHSERGLNSVKDIVQTSVAHLKHHLPFLRDKRKALRLE